MNYKTRAWRAIRRQVLARDSHTCQLKLTSRCTPTTNLCVDHTAELWEGGAEYPPPHALKTACRSCNSYKHMHRLLSAGNKPSRDW